MNNKPWRKLRDALMLRRARKLLVPLLADSGKYSPLRPWAVIETKGKPMPEITVLDYTLRRVANGWIVTTGYGETFVTEGKLDDALNRIKGEEIRREQDMEAKQQLASLTAVTAVTASASPTGRAGGAGNGGGGRGLPNLDVFPSLYEKYFK